MKLKASEIVEMPHGRTATAVSILAALGVSRDDVVVAVEAAIQGFKAPVISYANANFVADIDSAANSVAAKMVEQQLSDLRGSMINRTFQEKLLMYKEFMPASSIAVLAGATSVEVSVCKHFTFEYSAACNISAEYHR